MGQSIDLQLIRLRTGVKMGSREVINDTLVNLFNEILKLEEDVLVNGEFQNISVNDFHVINAIGIDEKDIKNMSTIAKQLDITVGSLTTAINALVRKGYVSRERSEKDRRVVTVKLTELGERAYHHHRDFHEHMTDAAVRALKADELPMVTKVLIGLQKFFRDYKQNELPKDGE